MAEPECTCTNDFRVALDIMHEDSGTNVVIGHIVTDFEEYLDLCTDNWYRLHKILERRYSKEEKSD